MKYEAKLDVLRLMQNDFEAFDMMVSNFSFARNTLNELIFDCCRRNMAKLKAGPRDYFLLHN